MRHERISQAKIAAAAWPSTLEGLMLAEPEAAEAIGLAAPELQTGATPAAPDIAPGVGGLIVAAYVSLVLVLFTFFTGSLTAMFMVVVAAGFVAIFFAVPRIFLAIEPKAGRRPSLPEFVEKGIDTLTGHSGGRDALLQMLIVPVLLTLGLLVMGIVGKIYI
jgi:hypothetical protein